MKKKLETVQIWSKKGLSDLSGETYFARRRALLNGISMINRLQFFKPEDEVAALQLIEMPFSKAGVDRIEHFVNSLV